MTLSIYTQHNSNECHYAVLQFFILMLSESMLSVIMLNVIMLIVITLPRQNQMRLSDTNKKLFPLDQVIKMIKQAQKLSKYEFKNRCLENKVKKLNQWKGINCKQSARLQHLSQLKASAFCIW